LHNKPKAWLYSGHKLTCPEEEEKNSGLLHIKPKCELHPGHNLTSPEEEEKEELLPIAQ
jgi:hypothetical protein